MNRAQLKQFLFSGECTDIHFVGIGGAGMSPVASLCSLKGFMVTGSDLVTSEITDSLIDDGITVHSCHRRENLGSARLVVISSAIPESNPEVVEALNKNLSVVSRAQLLGALMEDDFGIGIAGTHGKTSSTSICAAMFESLSLDPTVVVGGKPAGWKSNLRYGNSKYFIVEADESDGSFLEFPCQVALVTNIDDDHMDYYGSMESLCEYFLKFINGVGAKGLAVLCIDDENVRSVIDGITVPFVTYGTGIEADYRISKVVFDGFTTTFSLALPSDDPLDELSLNAPGMHYVLNCAGCCAIADFMGADHGGFKKAIASFSGVGRRFEIIGTAGGVKIIDDYAHHPTEITAVLTALSGSSSGRIVVAFQPHRIDRTKRLAARLGASLSLADKIFILPVYRPAGSSEPDNSSSELIYQSMDSGFVTLLKDSSLEDAASEIGDQLEEGDVFLTVGAGSITKLGPLVLQKLQ